MWKIFSAICWKKNPTNVGEFFLFQPLQHAARTGFARIWSSRNAPARGQDRIPGILVFPECSGVFDSICSISGGRGTGNDRIFGLREPVEGPVRVSECRAFGKAVNRRDDGGPAKDIALIEGKTNISPARAFHRVRPPKIRVPGTPSSRKNERPGTETGLLVPGRG